MNRNKHFLRSTTAKTNWLVIVLVIVGIAVLTGVLKVSTTGINFGVQNSNPSSPSIPSSPSTSGYTRPIQFHISNAFSGADSSSVSIYVFDPTTKNQIGSTLTSDSSGLAHTGKSFAQGDSVIVRVVSGNSKIEDSYTVPAILQGDTYANIEVPFFTIGTYTSDSLRVAGSSINDAGSYNSTLSGTSPTFVYELTNTGSDNTGLKESQNSITGQRWQVYMVVSISGTGYETISASGFSNQFSIGTTNYGATHLNADQLSKWKVGNDYVQGFTGDQAVSFSLDMSAYAGTAVTMQITAYAYCDPTYAAAHGGNFGSDKVTIAEQTVTLTV
jgi:hypothetical protein